MTDLKFDHVSKRYRIQEQDASTNAARWPVLRKLRKLRRPRKDFWALRDVSFEVPRGEALGIIGHNGAGKSTILKLLSNITTPTYGNISIFGRLSALIEVGSGFHPELTGRENVYLNGSILGMSRREISKKLDSIVEFAGVRQFIDTPVKRFSSGMYVRLGFSIAAHLEADILLLDEVLAVGDAAFQAKCLERISELKNGGTTIVFISHDLGAVGRLCDRALLMRKGELVASGAAYDVIATYQSTNDLSTGFSGTYAMEENRAAEIRGLSFHNAQGQVQSVFKTGEPLTARVEFEIHRTVKDVVLSVIFYSADGTVHCEFTTDDNGEPLEVASGSAAVEFLCPELGLLPDIYYTDVEIKERQMPEAISSHWRSTMLRVEPGIAVRGHLYSPHRWNLRSVDGSEEGVQDFGFVPTRT